MTATAAPPLPPVVLPELQQVATAAQEDRGGQAVVRVAVHRWGVAYTDAIGEAASYHGVVDYFTDPDHEASAHLVYPGSAVGRGRLATQMVPWSKAAWAEKDYNRSSDDVESADAIWLGKDWHGFHVLARMVAMRLHVRGLPATWSVERGFCRHGDLGAAGGGHPLCPTTDLHLWGMFSQAVKVELARGGFRRVWGID